MHSLALLLLVLSLSVSGCTVSRSYQATWIKPGQQVFPFKDIQKSDDPEYGFSPEKPIEVGGFSIVGYNYQHEFISNLRGPGGERLGMHRVRSCCPFNTASGVGTGSLDVWEVVMPDGTTRELFFSSFKFNNPRAPKGLSYRGLIERTFNNNDVQPSIHATILHRTNEINVNDGVSREEGIILAQHAMLTLGRSTTHDLARPLTSETAGVYFI